MATTNKNFKVKNGLEVAGEIGVGSTPSYGTTGQILSSQGAGNAAAWIDVAPAASYTSVVKHDVRLAEAITKGQAVYVSSSNGSNIVVSKASNASEATSSKTLGLLESSGSTNNQRNVVIEGLLGGIDVGAAAAGDPVWLGTSGNLIYGLTNKPIAPAHLVFIGIVTRDGNNGEIFIRIQNGFELNEIHNVLIGTDYTANSIPADNEFLAYNLGTNLWINQTAEEAGIANLSGATFTGNVAGTNLGLSGKNIFSNTGTGAPTFTTYSSGVRTVFYDNVGNTSVGYSRGIDAGVLWDSIPAADGGMYFKWYGGETQVASLSGTGVFTATTIVGNTNASTITTGTIDNARTTAASANGASTIVARDASGNFTANIVTANLTGTASSALQISTTANNSGGGNFYLTFVTANTSSTQTVYTDTGLKWTPATNALNAGYLTATSNVTAGENVSALNFVNNGAQLNVISTAYPMLIQAVDGITLSGPVTANVVANGTTTSAASGVGFMGIPQNTQSTNYSVVAGDAGKHIYLSASGTTVTIPANSNVAFPIGTTIVIVAGHSSGTTSIALTTDTLRLSAVGTTGTRTLASYGMATLVKVADTTWFISGNGLT